MFVLLEHMFEQRAWNRGQPGGFCRRAISMSKRYEEPIDVEAPNGSVETFWWRGKGYRVRHVLCRWREAGGWWASDDDADRPWLHGDAREIVRIDAIPITSGRAPGTYEIARDLRSGAWTLFRVWD
jgi:uncharacterized protein DUF6504